MPVHITKKDGYQVSHGGKVSAKNTSARKAMSQKRLLLAVEHGWKPGKSFAMKKYAMKMRAKGK